MRRRLIQVAVLLALTLVVAFAALARAEIVQRGNVRVSFDGKLTPHALPRSGTAPVRVAVATKIAATDGATPPQLRRISIAINRNGRFEPKGLPTCPLRAIQPSTTADALAACRSSLVGEGHFAANVMFSAQAPFPSRGKVYAFNSVIGCSPAERRLLREVSHPHPGRGWPSTSANPLAPSPLFSNSISASTGSSGQALQGRREGGEGSVHQHVTRTRATEDTGGRRAGGPCGRPAILAHVFGTDPVPTSFTLPFELKPAKGTFGTVLEASLPAVTGNSSYITGLSLNLGRNFTVHGKRRSYLSAGCPAPKGFPGATFPFAKASFSFAGKQTLTSTLTRSCTARG